MMVKNSLYMACASLCLVVSGCGYPLHTPSELNMAAIELEQGVFMERFAVSDLDAAAVRSIADYFYRYGGEMPMEVAVLYDPSSRDYTARVARSDAQDLLQRFNDAGLKQVAVRVVPLQGASKTSGDALVRFDTLEAKGPDGCGVMSGVGGRPTNLEYEAYKERGYKYGCTVEGYFAKQVARPRDLVREAEHEDTDARRSVSVVNGYVYGEPNEGLDSLNATEAD